MTQAVIGSAPSDDRGLLAAGSIVILVASTRAARSRSSPNDQLSAADTTAILTARPRVRKTVAAACERLKPSSNTFNLHFSSFTLIFRCLA